MVKGNPIIDKIFGKSAANITKGIGDAIDNLSTSDQEKLEAKEKLTNTVMTHLGAALNAAASIVLSESQGNWLQRSWRPILMLSFGFIVIYEYFIAPVFSLQASGLPDKFWNLLELGIGGYVIGRSAEKIAETVVKNVDVSFIKKKNREI